MIISREYNFIFVAVGRTGTTSIEKALKPFDDYEDMDCSVKYKDHAPICEIEEQLDLSSYYKFCFVRNPWDLVVSKYLCHNSPLFLFLANKSPFSRFFFRRWVEGTGTAEEYAYSEKNMSNLNVQYEYPLVDMHDFFLSSSGDVLVDDIFKYENIKSDFRRAADKIGLRNISLPHKNKGKKSWYGTDDYIEMYNKYSKRVVENHFKRDIKKFGYKF